MPDQAVTLIGRLTRDPELRFTASGLAVASFSLAVDRRWKAGNEWKSETSFFDCVAWKQLAENIAESMVKGSRVIVFGTLEQRTWDDKNGGGKRSKIEVQVQDIGLSAKFGTVEAHQIERRPTTSPQYAPDQEPF